MGKILLNAQLASQMFPIGHVYLLQKAADEDQFENLVKQVKESLGANDQILLKGSNSMNLAKLVESLENEDKWFFKHLRISKSIFLK